MVNITKQTASQFVLIIKYSYYIQALDYKSDEIKKDEMGGAYSIRGRRKVRKIFLQENLKGIKHLRDLEVNSKVILRWIFIKQGEVCELDSSGLGFSSVVGSCEHSVRRTRVKKGNL